MQETLPPKRLAARGRAGVDPRAKRQYIQRSVEIANACVEARPVNGQEISKIVPRIALRHASHPCELPVCGGEAAQPDICDCRVKIGIVQRKLDAADFRDSCELGKAFKALLVLTGH